MMPIRIKLSFFQPQFRSLSFRFEGFFIFRFVPLYIHFCQQYGTVYRDSVPTADTQTREFSSTFSRLNGQDKRDYIRGEI
jgi:hypothetical protein